MGSNLSSPGSSNQSVTRPTSKPIKVLLLGSGGSGKSTFVKQFKVLNDRPFSLEDIELFRQLIFDNLIHGIKALIDATEDVDLPLRGVRHQALHFTSNLRGDEPFPMVCKAPLKALWENPGFREAWRRGKSRTALSENLPYFFSSIDRLFDPSYVPNEQDIMRHSVRTTGISEMKFNINGYDVTVVDVGGQRSERRKWIHVMQDVTSILFSVNLNGYDQNLVEHENQNEMEDAMLLWASICRSERFKNCSIILLLNKFDLFEQKVATSDIKNFFPDFQGQPRDVDAACRYFINRFAELAKNAGRVQERAVNIFSITTTDTDMLRGLMPKIEE